MGVSEQPRDRRGGAGGPDPREVRYPAEAKALDKLPDCDVLRALGDLPDELKLTVYLADVRGYPYRQIAEIMGTPVGTVASRLHLGRGKLRDRLAIAAARRGLSPAAG